MTSRSPNSNLPMLTTDKYLAIPALGKRPVFEEIAGIALAIALSCNQSVCVWNALFRWSRASPRHAGGAGAQFKP